MRDFSGGIVFRNSKILMFYNEEEEYWDVPTAKREDGEILSEAASRITEEFTGCDAEVQSYKRNLKTGINTGVEEVSWHPYFVEIEGTPNEGEWIKKDNLEEKELSPPLKKIREELIAKI